MELTKNDTKMLQGLSVLAMVCLHLFDKDYTGLFQPLIFINDIPLSFYFGQLSDFCVFGFAFCSGYAHMKLFEQPNYYRKRLKSLLVLIINFWIVLLGFTIVSICAGQADFMPGTLSTFLGNVFLYNMTYNGAWWYLWVYVLLVLVSPLLLKTVKKLPIAITLIIGFAIYCASYYVRFQITTDNYFLVRFGPFGMTIFEYLLGCVAYKLHLFSNLKEVWVKIPQLLRWGGTCVLTIAFLLVRTLLVPSLFVAPVSGLIIISLFTLWKKPKWIKDSFLFVGKHATNIWLTHMFFYLVLFKDLVYIAKYPLLIFLFMLIITIPVSMIIQLIEKPFIHLLSKPKKEQTT